MVSYLGKRVRKLERQVANSAGAVNEPLSDHFIVAVSCPPDTSIHVRGGNVWEGSYWIGVGYGYYIAAYTADFSDPATIDNYTGNFANANYYKGIVFGREFYNEDHYVIGGDTEFATAAEAEADIENTALLAGPWRGYDNNGGLPLCGLILRNDGRTGVDGAILPIDGVNRGRSYYWKDLRPRHYIVFAGPD